MNISKKDYSVHGIDVEVYSMSWRLWWCKISSKNSFFFAQRSKVLLKFRSQSFRLWSASGWMGKVE